MKTYYYRFGEFPKNGVSSIWQGNECIGQEVGVSVYEVHFSNLNNTPIPVPPSPLSETALNDYVYHTRYFRGRKYLVIGDLLEKIGSNGEPLLSNVEIVGEIIDSEVKFCDNENLNSGSQNPEIND